MKHYDIVIVGGGPAGLTAAVYGLRAGLSVAVVEKNVPGGQMNLTERVENFPGLIAVSGSGLAQSMFDQAEAAGAVFYYGAAHHADLKSAVKTVVTAGETLTADAVILAVGVSSKTLGLKGESELVGSGISYCATCDGAFFKGKDVMIAGGGKTAADDAAYLSPLVNKLYLVDKGSLAHIDCPRAEKSEYAQVIALTGNPLQSVRIAQRDGETRDIAVAGLFVAVGHAPDTFWLQGQIGLDDKGYIIADGKNRTDIDGVYAAGDATANAFKQIVAACAAGAKAATEAAKYCREAKSKKP